MTKRGEMIQTEVLSVLCQRGEPLSAYDVLGKLRERNPKIAPPTIYRALAALTERGCVHRLESMNAYIACQHDTHRHASILSICDDCGSVEENVAPDILDRLASVIEQSGFAPIRHVIEIHGRCASCGTGGVPA